MSVKEVGEEVPNRTGPTDNGPGGLTGPTESVDRIRDILFGAQMREYGQRFNQIEERVWQETTELKAEVRRRLDSLEAFTRQEANELAGRLRTERSERHESADQLSRAFAQSFKSLEACLLESDGRLSNDLRELRQLTLERLKSLLDDFSQQIRAVEDLQHRHLEELRANTIDRLGFATFLSEMALRIRNEFRVTGFGETSDGGSKP